MTMQTLDQRLANLQEWIEKQIQTSNFTVSPLAGDASFRRYFRVKHEQQSFVAMDAPPDKEDSLPFVTIAKIFKQHGLQVPELFATNLSAGFLLLSDLGDDLYFRVLNPENASALYHNAIRDLLIIQTCQQNQVYHFPFFDQMMVEELERFREWYLLKHLNVTLSESEEILLKNTFTKLVTSAIQQPQVCVHRDYHSRNLLQLANQQVGILDFQDAVWGPITYDLVSLIRDCYIAWPNELVEQWASHYFQQARQAGILVEKNPTEFLRWFDWMGIQRHLKAIYIFARKWHRDQNPNYLPEIPRTLNYVMTMTGKYPEFREFRNFLSEKISL